MPEAKREIIPNIARLNAYLDRHRLRAVVARSGMNAMRRSDSAAPGTPPRRKFVGD